MTTHPHRRNDLRRGPAPFRTALIAAAPWLSLACGPAASGSSTVEPESTPPPAADSGPVTSEPVVGAFDEERPAFEHCVLHAGSGQGRRVDGVLQDAECTFGAECIETPGQMAPNDGFVDLSCRGTECQCILARSMADSAAYTFSFSLPEPCAEVDTAKQLLLEHCMEGQQLEPEAAP